MWWCMYGMVWCDVRWGGELHGVSACAHMCAASALRFDPHDYFRRLVSNQVSGSMYIRMSVFLLYNLHVRVNCVL